MLDQHEQDFKVKHGVRPSHEKARSNSDTEAAHDHGHQLNEETSNATELVKNRSTAQVAFMSSALSAIPMGISVSLYYGLINGGAADLLWGFILVSLIICCVALSLAEITSVYPTAGGVYYQTYMLTSGRWRRLTAWICGWSYVIGNVLVTLAVNFSTILFILDGVNIFGSDPNVPLYSPEKWHIFLMFVALTLLCTAASAVGNKWLPYLDAFSLVCNAGGGLAILITVVAVAKNGRHSAEYIFTDFKPLSGWTPGWAFFIGLLTAAYSTSSTGMIISISEEVRDPGIQVPRAMMWTIVLNTMAGTGYILALNSILPDLQVLIELEQPLPYIIKSAVGSAGGTFALLVPMILLGICAGIGCTTTSSRCIWAFARDGAIPGSHLWSKIDTRLVVPLNAFYLSAAVQIIVAVISLGSTTAFNSFSSAAVIFLTVSYTIPIVVSFFTGRKHLKNGRFHFKRFGAFCNVVSIAWCALSVPLFCMPGYLPVDAESMNYASVVFVTFVLISAGWYWAWGHKNYHGPPVHINGQFEVSASEN